MSDYPLSSECSSEGDQNLCHLCKDELGDDGFTHLKEWLRVDALCDSCVMPICGMCLYTCLSCYNENLDDPQIICKKCNTKSKLYDSIGCNYHWWPVCKKHAKSYQCKEEEEEENARCPQCQTNHNYTKRHE